MSSGEASSSKELKPHRCAYLLDNVIDAIHHWNKDNIRDSYKSWRYCMKHPEINADMTQKPQLITVKQNADEMFDIDKVNARVDELRKKEKERKKRAKEGEANDGNDTSL